MERPDFAPDFENDDPEIGPLGFRLWYFRTLFNGRIGSEVKGQQLYRPMTYQSEFPSKLFSSSRLIFPFPLAFSSQQRRQIRFRRYRRSPHAYDSRCSIFSCSKCDNVQRLGTRYESARALARRKFFSKRLQPRTSDLRNRSSCWIRWTLSRTILDRSSRDW
jgi:hypothetical protein